MRRQRWGGRNIVGGTGSEAAGPAGVGLKRLVQKLFKTFDGIFMGRFMVALL